MPVGASALVVGFLSVGIGVLHKSSQLGVHRANAAGISQSTLGAPADPEHEQQRFRSTNRGAASCEWLLAANGHGSWVDGILLVRSMAQPPQQILHAICVPAGAAESARPPKHHALWVQQRFSCLYGCGREASLEADMKQIIIG